MRLLTVVWANYNWTAFKTLMQRIEMTECKLSKTSLFPGDRTRSKKKKLIFPSSLIEFKEGIGDIWITNGGIQLQMIPKGMNLGRMCDVESGHVCPLNVEPGSSLRESREDDDSHYLSSMINPDLPEEKNIYIFNGTAVAF
ncbi:hypothetical protein LAZ67_6001867 [Cordylochernes scorpioides]|uniref:Uncharacterized protein n=1 Tax=Cordylochernes scorpioides TaxID=51811 RepID=A0ABY6KLA3_9ARAC|nr:hypothetical protein LAZ67_6001867 [Cordylochernes scorpioides]